MRSLLLLLLSLLVFTPQSLRAEDEKQDPTRIDVNQETGSFIFISKGEPIARLDGDGLHVLDNVTYGGLLIDKNDGVREALAGKAESTEMKEE